MIRFKLAVAGILIVPALAPAQEPKPAGSPPAESKADRPSNGQGAFYLESDLVPFGHYSVARPGSGLDLYTPLKPTYHQSKPAQDDPLQANFGLQLAPADEALRAQLEIAPGRGVVVLGVKPGSLAEQAGLKPNDVLVKLGDQEADGVESATKVLLGLGNKALEVKLIREGKPSRMSLVGPEHGFPPEAAEFWIGVPVSPVDPTLRSHLPSLESDVGLIANDVVKGSPADAAGLLKNDILVAMGGQSLKNADSLIEQIQATKGKPTPLEVLRAGKATTLSVTPARRAHPTTINLPGNRPKNWVYRLVEPHVAVEVNPKAAQDGRPQAPSLPDLTTLGVRNWSRTGPLTYRYQPDVKWDAIVVNPYRVNGANLGNPAEPQYDIHLRMAPSVETPDATARIEARLNEISTKLEEIHKALVGIKKADGK